VLSRAPLNMLLCVIESPRMAESSTLDLIRQLVAAGEVRISEHGYDELAEDDIFVRDLIDGIGDATVVEDYPSFAKGPAVLVLQFDRDRRPVHIVWGIPKGFALLLSWSRPIVLIQRGGTTRLLRG
jgi:hypothetical protein